LGVCLSDEDVDEISDDVFRVPRLASLKGKCEIRRENVFELLRDGSVQGWAEDEHGKIFMVKVRAKGQLILPAT
jgi:hypothetical protein